jgi:hypothetical protein
MFQGYLDETFLQEATWFVICEYVMTFSLLNNGLGEYSLQDPLTFLF